jgi:hypothetical protein
MKTHPRRREDARRAIDEWTGPDPARSAAPAGEERTRVRAYELWEAAGHPEGDGVEFWLEAERELDLK